MYWSPVPTVMIIRVLVVDDPTIAQDSSPTSDYRSTGPSSNGSLAQLEAASDPPEVNMLHLELVLHFSIDVYVPELDGSLGRPATELVLRIAQGAPFLMHGVLAISARHLSIIRPDDSARYLDQAFRLQTRAIELFNLTHDEPGREDCVARLLFSSVLGRHILSDALRIDGLDFPSFLKRFVYGIRIHSGVKAVAAQQDWTSLLGTELGPLMTRGLAPDLSNKSVEPSETMQSLISNSKGLGEEDKSACEEALWLIEVGLDELRDPARIEFGRRMMFTWSIMLPDHFIGLLERQVPEALVILGRYAIFLHFGAMFWQIGEAGPCLLRALSAHVGPMWQPWLSWPKGLEYHTTFQTTFQTDF